MPAAVGEAEVTELVGRDRAEADALVDRAMRPGEALSMTEDFPLLVGPAARSRRVVARESGRIVAHAAGRTMSVDVGPGRVLRLLNIGAVCTEPEARGRGLASALIRRLGADGTRRGHGAAILWTGVPDLYERLGFRHAGWEARFVVGLDDTEVRADVEVRPLARGDAAGLRRLVAGGPCRVRRAAAEAEVLFALPRSATWVARHGGRLAAYVVLGKGLDYPGMIAEWGGDQELLPVLLREVLLASGQDRTAIFGAGWDEAFVATFAARGCPREDGPLAWMLPLHRVALGVAVGVAPTDPILSATDAVTRIFGVPGQTPGPALPLPFYVPGLDSM